MSRQPTAQDVIGALNMIPHPEGGYFTENFRSATTVAVPTADSKGTESRLSGTSIHFLLEHAPGRTTEAAKKKAVSRLHKLANTNETFYFHPSSHPLTLVEIHNLNSSSDAKIVLTRMGQDLVRGEVLQHTFAPDVWFGAFTDALVDNEEGFSLVGCACAPGFDEEHFELIDENVATQLRILLEKEDLQTRLAVERLL
ncbi:RmlC-like cupin domain-containing protein [Gaertneriomyces semiglobifer]|nr:RmlC-like cupin domain-containing protein [Gaertneriomyces semiglobifer]